MLPAPGLARQTVPRAMVSAGALSSRSQARRWRRLRPGGPEHASRHLGPSRAGGGGQNGVAAVHGAGRPEPGADGIQFTVPGVDGK